jgi:predicted transcriptional regulator
VNSIDPTPLPPDLRGAIRAAGHTQKSFGDLVGLSEAAISMYCDGYRPANSRSAAKIAEALGLVVETWDAPQTAGPAPAADEVTA